MYHTFQKPVEYSYESILAAIAIKIFSGDNEKKSH